MIYNFLRPTSDISTYITSSMYNGSVFVAPLSPKRKQKSEMQQAHTFFDVSMDFQGTYSSYNSNMKKGYCWNESRFFISNSGSVAHSRFWKNTDLFLRRFVLSISLNGLYNVILLFLWYKWMLLGWICHQYWPNYGKQELPLLQKYQSNTQRKQYWRKHRIFYWLNIRLHYLP